MPKTKSKPEKKTKATASKPKSKAAKKVEAPAVPPAATTTPDEPAAIVVPQKTVDAPPSPAVTTKPEESRLPPVGTVIRKLDRAGNVRCECTVVANGVSYAGTVYRSLSAAAIAAAKDLGLVAKSMNGYSFWGLSKPVRASSANPLAALDRAWDRYQHRLGDLLEKAKAGELREPLLATVLRHARVLQNQHDEVDREKALPPCPACGGEGEEREGELVHRPCRFCRGEGVLRVAS